MSIPTSTQYGPGALGDLSDVTYTDHTVTNETASPIVQTLRVECQLAIVGEHGDIASVVFAARASKGTALGAWGEARIELTLSGSDPVTIVTLPEGLTPLTAIESDPQALAPNGLAWTWQRLADTLIAVEVDVTLDPGESATLRVGEVSARTYSDADRPYSLVTVQHDSATQTVISDNATVAVVVGD